MMFFRLGICTAHCSFQCPPVPSKLFDNVILRVRNEMRQHTFMEGARLIRNRGPNGLELATCSLPVAAL